ncbi:MAG: heavy metal translocating P-type ATPase [Candidatus Limnocylindrales bacterium]
MSHHDHHEDGPEGSFWDARNVRLALVAGVSLAIGIATEMLGGPDPLATVAFLVAVIAGGSTFIPETLRGLRHGGLGVGTLMTIAAIGAVLLGELGEAASLVFLFSIAEALESYSLTQARRGLRSLLELVPATASVVRGGAIVVIPASDLRVGDRIVLRPGQRLATDAVIREGRSALDLSAITGESTRVEVGPGDAVAAGAVNGTGALDLEATATAEDNSLARIVHIVEEAQERKGESQRLADRIARPLVPGIIIVALVAAIGGSLLDDPAVWIPRSLVILVAAAPCAFAIAVPVTVVAAIGAASRRGILIKGGAAIEALAGVGIVALDKTGTLTRNEPRVIAVQAADGCTREDVMAIAAALEARSEHPLAPAILAAAPGVTPATDVAAVPGHGLTGTIDGQPARLGRPGFIDAAGWEAPIATAQDAGATSVLVEYDGRTVGLIAVRDELRPEARATVEALRERGLEVRMLTGDHRRTAIAIAAAAGIEHVEADLRPEDKSSSVEGLRARRPVAMVGDGINDAPALASADVGLAMGAMGSDVAIETADIALMGEDLRHLPVAIDHARRTNGIMRQNLVLSGAILVALVPLAAVGALGLAAVVAVHEVAEIVVIANGLRARQMPVDLAAAPVDASGAAT